jgi:hypothetical protein
MRNRQARDLWQLARNRLISQPIRNVEDACGWAEINDGRRCRVRSARLRLATTGMERVADRLGSGGQ